MREVGGGAKRRLAQGLRSMQESGKEDDAADDDCEERSQEDSSSRHVLGVPYLRVSLLCDGIAKKFDGRIETLCCPDQRHGNKKHEPFSDAYFQGQAEHGDDECRQQMPARMNLRPQQVDDPEQRAAERSPTEFHALSVLCLAERSAFGETM